MTRDFESALAPKRWFALAGPLLALLWLLQSGCGTPGSPVSRPPVITSIHLMSTPVGLNLDPVPGSDGVGVKVYAVDRTKPKAVRIQAGTLDLLMFDGTVHAMDIATNTPMKVWSFTSETLPQFGGETSIGYGYTLTLPWGSTAPKQAKVTVAARYQPPQGPPILSAPSSVTVR